MTTTISLTFDLAILYLVAANVIVILLYTLNFKIHRRRLNRNIAAISRAIVDYFGRSSTAVTVGCISRSRGRQFTAFINSEPLKRFRYSHIVEAGLRDHVLKELGLDLERVFWRFQVRMAQTAIGPADPLAGTARQENPDDSYISERLLRLKAQAEYEVTTASWEQFEEALHTEQAEIVEVPLAQQ